MTGRRGPRPGITAEELKAKLAADPQYRAMMEQKERERAPVIAANMKAGAPVVAELNAAGFPVETIGDLYNRRLDYRDAIPILVAWLPRIDNPPTKESIVRALSVRWTPRAVARLLIDEYYKGPVGYTPCRWAIGNALAVLATDEIFEEVLAMARDRRYGGARERVVESLGNMKDARAVEELIGFLDDPDVRLPAMRALGKLGRSARRARDKVEPFASDPAAWVRKEALRTLKRIS